MSAELTLDKLKQLLDDTAGQHLRNTLYIPGKTCVKCRGTKYLQAGNPECGKCMTHGTGTADLVGSMIYGGPGLASGDMLYDYKLAPQDRLAVLKMTMLVVLGFAGHCDCADALVGRPVEYWAAVPSLENIGKAHPFRGILTQSLGPSHAEIAVAASKSAQNSTESERRQLNPGHFTILSPVPKGKHVMVIDDTWASGGHAQSVATALKRAGAANVSILAVGRWLAMRERQTAVVYDHYIDRRPFNPDICPWTGGDCPSRLVSGDQRRNGRRPMRCSLHNIELTVTGECGACARLIDRGKKSTARRKPWYQFW